jgi:hypothetical protein
MYLRLEPESTKKTNHKVSPKDVSDEPQSFFAGFGQLHECIFNNGDRELSVVFPGLVGGVLWHTSPFR